MDCLDTTVINVRLTAAILVFERPVPALSSSGEGGGVQMGRQAKDCLRRNVPQQSRPCVHGWVGDDIIPERGSGDSRASLLEHAQNVAGGSTLGVRVLRLGVSVSVALVLGAAVLEPHLHLADRKRNVLGTSSDTFRILSQ